MTQKPVLVLIDGHAVAYRQFFAIRADAGFSTREGEPTNATYGFARLLIDVLQGIRPEYIAVSFDLGLGGRDALYPAYKGTRSAMPDDLVRQIPRIYELVRAFNIPVLELPDAEADDVIGTIARQTEEYDVLTHIITGDQDILQLLTEKVRVQLPTYKGDDKVYDIPAFVERYGFQPPQLIDYKALVGDSSDNIPGVPGIGEKSAKALLAEYGSLDNIYANLDAIKEQQRAKLVAGRESAYLSRKLATIITDLPLKLNLKQCEAHDFDVSQVDDLFTALEFRSIRDRLKLFKPQDTPSPTLQAFAPETVIVRTPEALQDLLKQLEAAPYIVFDTETTSTDPMAAALVGIALAVDEDRGYYIPVGHVGQGTGTLFAEPAESQLSLSSVIEALRPALTNPAVPKIAHNAVYDLVVLHNHGLEVTPLGFDTMIAEWVRDPVSRFLGLKNFARQELRIVMTEIDQLIGTGKKQIPMSQVPIDDAAPYAAADAVVTLKAYRFLQAKLREPAIDMDDLFHRLEMPLVPIVAKMERAGALLDLDEVRRQSQDLAERMAQLELAIYAQAGTEFNINSPKQLNDVLFGQMGLSVQGLKKTTHGYSTDITTLEALRSTHPVIPLIVDYRELSKLKSTYLDALPALVNVRTRRVHTSYNQTGTSTGRFSSSNPNLQNIPIRTQLGREVRRIFIAPQGKVLLSVDYSQIELRIMAHMSGDETLQQAFHDDLDIHRATAAAVFGIPLQDVTYEQRSFAKRVNFGLMYGMGGYRLARESDLTRAEADQFIKTYFERFPGVQTYLDRTRNEARQNGFVETLFGRKRFFARLHQGGLNNQDAEAELRAAINAPIQGTAADILKLAMLKLHRDLSEDSEVAMILQVHDELVFEVPAPRVTTVAQRIIHAMENALEDNPLRPVTLAVPLRANAEYGANWLEMQPI
jgi:DNA polymerase-1